MKIVTLILSLFMLPSCGAVKASDDTDNTLFGDYNVIIFDDESSTSETLKLNFSETDNKVSGHSGCNNFSGTYTVDGDKISISQLAATRKYCPNLDSEQKLLTALTSATSFSIKENVLQLRNANKMLVKANKQVPVIKIAQGEVYNVSYTAVTRGFSLSILVENDIVTYRVKKGQDLKSRLCTQKELAAIYDSVKAINLADLGLLVPPSVKHQSDAALGAALKITYKTEEFKTKTFDHGNPPKEIEALVSVLLTLTEKVD